MSWYSYVQTDIYTQVKYRLRQSLLSTFPDLYVTMDDTVLQEPKFPTVYLHYLTPRELAKTLDGHEVNAVDLSLRIEVTVSKEQGMNAATIVSDKVTDIFKSFEGVSFTMSELAHFENNSPDTKRMIFQAHVIVGSGDTVH